VFEKRAVATRCAVGMPTK